MTAAEIAHGHHFGMLGAADLVRMAELAIPASGTVGAALADLAILLPDELDSVEQLVATIDESVEDSADDASRIWLYLSLLSLYDRRASLADPMGELEQIYTDFDYAEEIEGFVPFLPAPAGSEPGRDALEMRWSAYLDDRRHELAHRVRPSRHDLVGRDRVAPRTTASSTGGPSNREWMAHPRMTSRDVEGPTARDRYLDSGPGSWACGCSTKSPRKVHIDAVEQP